MPTLHHGVFALCGMRMWNGSWVHLMDGFNARREDARGKARLPARCPTRALGFTGQGSFRRLPATHLRLSLRYGCSAHMRGASEDASPVGRWKSADFIRKPPAPQPETRRTTYAWNDQREREKRFEKRRADSRLAPADAAARFGLDCGPFEFALEREHLTTPVDHAAWLPVGHDATKGLTR